MRGRQHCKRGPAVRALRAAEARAVSTCAAAPGYEHAEADQWTGLPAIPMSPTGKSS